MKNLVPEDDRIFNRPSNKQPISEFFDLCEHDTFADKCPDCNPPGYDPALEGKPVQLYYFENDRQRKPRKGWQMLSYSRHAQQQANLLKAEYSYHKVWYEAR